METSSNIVEKVVQEEVVIPVENATILDQLIKEDMVTQLPANFPIFSTPEETSVESMCQQTMEIGSCETTQRRMKKKTEPPTNRLPPSTSRKSLEILTLWYGSAHSSEIQDLPCKS